MKEKSVYQLMTEWEQDGLMKSWHDYEHPGFKEVVSRGEKAIPELVKLLTSNDEWFPVLALFRILGDKAPQVGNDDCGRLSALIIILTRWAKENGY